MLPGEWQKKLVDMNVTALSDDDLKWADYVFLSAMVVQRQSVKEVIQRCQKVGVKIVAGGPLFSTGYDGFEGVDHFVLGEAEVTLPQFMEDLDKGVPKHIYSSNERPELEETPLPLWPLINMKHYSSMNIQYSRGCPFNCEFCDIIILNGHKPRTKTKAQLIREMETLYQQGWRGSLFIVDDNFIGNKKKLKAETLPAVIEWMEEKRYPFNLFTEASINLADDEELMQLMGKAGFDRIFVGIETPNEKSLLECNKLPNTNRDLVKAVKKIQNHGFEVQGGFIVGFDNDPITIFKNQISFIQKSGIVTAMVGLLDAPRGTRLYQRLKKENRLLKDSTGDNTDCSINFIPKMKLETLIDGYKHILDTIYSPKQFYERIKIFLKEYHPPQRVVRVRSIRFHHLKTFIKSVWVLGIKEKGRRHYWQLFVSTLLKRPKSLPICLTLAVYGFHFRKIAEQYLQKPVGHSRG